MLKKFILLFVLLIAGLFFAPNVLAVEKIDNFESSIKINSDASINIEEKIYYNFGEEQKHGIFREISIKYKARGGNYSLRISDIEVKNEKGDSYNFEVSYPGNYVKIKIGDADKFVSGEKVYNIYYKIEKAINYFDSYDELYWNITGNEWEIPIEQSKGVIYFPQDIEESGAQKDCFAGKTGSDARCSSQKYIYDENLVKGTVFKQDLLQAEQGLTVVIGFPKGLVTQPSKFQVFLEILRDNWVLFLPIIVFGGFFYLWHTRGRDPVGRGTIIPEFEAPNNLTPIEVGSIINEKVRQKDISAEIINLAVKGYIKIICLQKKAMFKSADFTLEKLKSEDNSCNKFEKELMQGLFSHNKESVKLSSLKNKFFKILKKLKDNVYISIVDKKYFAQSPRKTKMIYIGSGIAVLFLGPFLGAFWGSLGILSFTLSGIIIIVFGFFMPVKTKKGVLAKEHILGFKKYLSVAEKARLEFHNAPEKNPKQFEKLLPYAMVLGVEKEWAKQFEGIYNEAPSWYAGYGTRMITPLILVSGLNSFQSNANTILASHPASTASGGGSGFSGGGSGGGFGGGGGGSW